MASENSLNLKNLKALGAERLAELLLELASGDASAKRRFVIDLTGSPLGREKPVQRRTSGSGYLPTLPPVPHGP